MNISVQIERLLIDGLPLTPEQGLLLQAAVEAELAGLLTVGGLASSLLSGGAVPYLPAGAIHLTVDSNPTHLGQQIARAVYAGIGRYTMMAVTGLR